ncbi:hypothetical protein OEZ86_001874 [Tetradesmus obliquus]|nr:hypothetical protein OEZ86_001874 [Tetradesmus obliquus]
MRDLRTRPNAAEDAPAAGTSSRPEAAAAAAATAAADPAAATAAAAADGAAAAAAASSSIDSLSVLTSTEPIDRLRYQALLMFDHWDSSSSGRLSGEQLGQFFTWCTRKVSWSPGLSEVLAGVTSSWASLAQTGCSREQFVRIIRSQVHAVSTSAAYTGSMMRPDEAARLQAQMSLNKTELAAAKWVFGLLDFDNDGKVALSMYKAAQGIEAYVYEDKIEDADADDDGLISFEEFLVSYAKPKPIGKNMLIMAINTAAIFFILQAPFLDVMLKVVLVGVLMLRPQLISRPAALLYDAIKAIVDSSKAQAEVAKANRGVWRPA